MGQHTWLLLATICTELLVIRKWSRGMFVEPFPIYVKIAWSVGAVILTVYPIFRVSSWPPFDLPFTCGLTRSALVSSVFPLQGGIFADNRRGWASAKLTDGRSRWMNPHSCMTIRVG